MHRIFATALLVLTGFLPTGCSSGDADGAETLVSAPAATLEERAMDFLAALEAADPGAAERFLTERARAGLAGSGSWQIDGESLESYEVVETVSEGEAGDVTVQLVVNGEEQTLRLHARREKDEWAFSGMTVDMGEGVEWPVDFEAMATLSEAIGTGIEGALQDWQIAVDDASRTNRHERFAELTSLSMDEHDQHWQIDLVTDARPAHEALAEVLDGTGIEFERRRELDTPVSVDLRGISRLAAVEWLAHETGLRPIYPQLGFMSEGLAFEIVFERGTRLESGHPIALCGPFLVEIVSIVENPPHTTGAVELAVRGLGLTPQALALCAEMQEFLVVDDVRDGAGGDLRVDKDVRYWTQANVEGSYFQMDMSVDLRGLLRGVDELARVAGFVQLALPVEVTATELAPVKPGADSRETTAGPWAIEHRAEDGSQRFAIRRPGSKLDDLRLAYDPMDSEGEPVGVEFDSGMSYGDVYQGDLQIAGEAARIGLKLVETRTVAYPFELTGLALRAYEEQPEKMRELDFSGEAPMAIEFVRFTEREGDRGEVELKLHNRSNKAVESALVSFVYLDTSGNVLGDFPHSLSGEYTFEGPVPLVDPDGEKSQQCSAFFMPEGTVGLRVELQRAEFEDASTWERTD